MALDEAAQAQAQVWRYAFGYVEHVVVKTAVELEIADVLEEHGGPISLSDLSTAVDCPSAPLYRIMRFLIHHGVFEKTSDPAGINSPPSIFYAQTPLSRLFTRDKIGPFMLLQGRPQRIMDGVTVEALRTGKRPDLKTVNGEDSWTHKDLGHSKRFTDAMTSHTRVTASAIVGSYPEAFEGVETVVDVGGHHGMALSMLVKAFPWVRGVCFDLPDIVAKATPLDGVELVGGNMFDSVPKADAVMLMWVLHNWSDKACVDILKKCKEAVPTDTGKVMIVEAIIDEDGEGDEYTEARLLLDMQMLAVTVGGKERTYKEWVHLLKEAGFSRHTVKNIGTIESVIEAYP